MMRVPAYLYGYCGEGKDSVGTVTLDERRYRGGAYDADTVDLEIVVPVDIGFRTVITGTLNFRIRLKDLNAPELRGDSKKAGQAARDWMRDRLVVAERLGVETFKEGKYGGRWIGIIYADGESLNDALIEAGHAVYKEY